MSILTSFLICIFIVLVSHLTVDKDIPDDMKVGAWVVFGILAVLYIIFGIIL